MELMRLILDLKLEIMNKESQSKRKPEDGFDVEESKKQLSMMIMII